MTALLDKIFRHREYCDVLKAFEEVTTKRKNAFDLWCSHFNHHNDNSYSFKKLIFSHLSEIREIDIWINKASHYISTNREAILWLYNDHNISQIPHLSYNEYKFIASNESKIKKYISTLSKFSSVYHTYTEASRYYINSNTLTFKLKEKIASAEDEIKEIDSLLITAKNIKGCYPKAWKVFSNNKELLRIPIDKLKSINQTYFSVKEKFLNLYEQNKSLIQLILGPKFTSLSSFDEETFIKESYVINSLLEHKMCDFNSYEGIVNIENIDALKRAILDSEDYGLKCTFVDSYSIPSFYKLRLGFENVSSSFNSALSTVTDFREAIKAYNSERSNESVVFINNYLESVSPNEPLYNYLEIYRQEKTKRDEAKKIKEKYPLGFSSLFGDIDINSCSISEIQSILNSVSRIESKHIEIKRIEQERIEIEERNRKLQQAKDLATTYPIGFKYYFPNSSFYSITHSNSNEILWKEDDIIEYHNYHTRIKQALSNWDSVKGIPYYFFYYYYPTRFIDVSSTSDEARRMIWNFKNGISQSKVIDLIKSKITSTFLSSDICDFTFVCIPASTISDNNCRYREFSKKLCSSLNMRNAFDYINITKEKTPAHLSPTHTASPAEYSFNTSFFSGAKVILFDDVVTKGHSMQFFKDTLESLGATIICAISIGRTYSDYYGDDRKPHPYTGRL